MKKWPGGYDKNEMYMNVDVKTIYCNSKLSRYGRGSAIFDAFTPLPFHCLVVVSPASVRQVRSLQGEEHDLFRDDARQSTPGEIPSTRSQGEGMWKLYSRDLALLK